jgi:large subunit ribosomal protein L20
MPRVTRGFKARRRRNKVLSLAKGFRGGKHRLFRTATEAVDRALCYAYRDSRLIGGLTKNAIELDRKVLSNLAIVDPNAFAAVVRTAGQLPS